MSNGIKAATSVDAFIGEKIRGYRNQQKLSQEELGRRLGVTFQQIQKYEKGVNRITSSRLDQIAQIFQCELTDLLPVRTRGRKAKGLTNVDRVVATREGMKLIDSFVTIKNEAVRSAIVELARRCEGI